MDTIFESSSGNNCLVKQLSALKKNRIKAEEQASMLKSKISSLRSKEKLSDQRIEKFKSLTRKIEDVRKIKKEFLQQRESKKEEYDTVLRLQKRFNVEESRKTQRIIQEKMGRLFESNKKVRQSVREKQKFDEFLINEEYLRKKEENISIKSMLQSIKDITFKEHEYYSSLRSMEIQELYNNRVQEENNILLSKYEEKSMMQEVDFEILETLQAGYFAKP